MMKYNLSIGLFLLSIFVDLKLASNGWLSATINQSYPVPYQLIGEELLRIIAGIILIASIKYF